MLILPSEGSALRTLLIFLRGNEAISSSSMPVRLFSSIISSTNYFVTDVGDALIDFVIGSLTCWRITSLSLMNLLQ